MTESLVPVQELLEAEGFEVGTSKGALSLRTDDGDVRVEAVDEGVMIALAAPITGPTLRLLPGADDDERRERLARVVAEVELARTGLLTATVDGDDVRFQHGIRADGLSRHALAAAIGEILKARRQMEAALVGRLERLDVEDLFPEMASGVAPSPSEVPAFSPTHAAPATGLAAWDRPDPEAPATATIPAGSRLQMISRWGDWAEIQYENGWRGWVDARMLVTL